MAVVKAKDGVAFTVIAPGGFRILGALDHMAALGTEDLTITSACDGAHSGPDDPHHRGEAYDIRTHDLADKQRTLSILKGMLGTAFYAFLEDEGTPNEHIHCQVKKGTTYP
jgi:hypothetical protein